MCSPSLANHMKTPVCESRAVVIFFHSKTYCTQFA